MPDRDEALRALKGLSDEDLRAVIGEIVLDPRVRRAEGLQGWWRRWAGTAAFLTILAITVVGFFRVGSIADQARQASEDASAASHEATRFAGQLRRGLIQNCAQNGNPLRRTVQGILRDQIKQSRAADLSRFFPQIPPAELEALTRKANRQRRARIREIAPVGCRSLYPRPPRP